MKNLKRYMAFGLCALLMCDGFTVFASYASVTGPMSANQTPAQRMGVSEEDYQRYMDNRLEYEEIDALVHHFNPSVSEAWKDYQSNADEISRNISDLEAGKRDISSLAEEAKEDGDFENYGMYKAQEIALSQMVKSLNKSKKTLTKDVSIGNESLRNAERQVSHAVKSLMVNYLSLRKQMGLLEHGITLSEQMLEISRTTTDVGAAIMQSTVRANSELAKNKADLEKLRQNAENMRRTLITMLGWDVNAQPEIVDIHIEDHVNTDIINAIDLEADIKAAIGNNYALISLRRAKPSRNFTKTESRDTSEKQMEDHVRIDIIDKQQKIKVALLDYEAAKTALQAGEVKERAAAAKLRLGGISHIRYNESALEYNQARINSEVSGLNLLLVYLDYRDAIHGNASVE